MEGKHEVILGGDTLRMPGLELLSVRVSCYEYFDCCIYATALLMSVAHSGKASTTTRIYCGHVAQYSDLPESDCIPAYHLQAQNPANHQA